MDARVADATHDADADVDVDAGFADAAPGDAAPADAGPEGAWRTVHQAPSTDTLQRLSVSTNARGDGAIAWERFPGVLQAVVYSEATQSWGPVTTFPRPEYYRGSPMVRVLPDGAVLMVYVETAISGASRELRAMRFSRGGWAPSVLVAALRADPNEGIVLRDLLVDGDGNAAFSFQLTTAGTSFASYAVVLTPTGWRREELGGRFPLRPTGAPIHLALDARGVLHALYVGYEESGPPTLDLRVRRYSFADRSWARPAVVLRDAARYTCESSAPCYALAVEPGGHPVVLTWDAVGGFRGTVTPHRFNFSGFGTWDPDTALASDTTPPLLRSGGAGQVIAVYGTVGPQQLSQLETRRLDTRTGVWAAPERLEPFAVEDAQMNAAGAVIARGNVATNVATTVAFTTSEAGPWSAPALVEDYAVCFPRDIAIAADDLGALVAQLCLSAGGDVPFSVRARRVPIR